MNYINDGLPLLLNSQIIEYDIQSGNTSIMRRYGLLPATQLDEIDRMPKKERNITVGLLQKGNKGLAKALEEGFNKTVLDFLEANGLDIDVDVLAIRKDAVFVINRPVTKTRMDDHVLFRQKGVYHAVLQIGPKLEFYFPQNGPTEVKNFIQAEKDENNALEKLRPGMISFLEEFVTLAEGSNMDRLKIYQWLTEFCTYYKERDLDPEYYREFTREASFRVRYGDEDMFYDYIEPSMIDDLDIYFNYKNIIVPLMSILI